MEKKIDDYIHFYRGCECEFEYNGRRRKGIIIGFHHLYGVQLFVPSAVMAPYTAVDPKLIKLILRPLSSITQAERDEYKELGSGYAWDDHDERYCKSCYLDIGEPHIWVWLLSKAFDLFGLIEAGLAIEKK